jgi:hypothetical protein
MMDTQTACFGVVLDYCVFGSLFSFLHIPHNEQKQPIQPIDAQSYLPYLIQLQLMKDCVMAAQYLVEQQIFLHRLSSFSFLVTQVHVITKTYLFI